MRIFYFIFSLLAFASCSNNPSTPKELVTGTDTTWQLGPFIKADAANPILLPDSSQTFFCPIRKQITRWEEKDVFNPASVIRNDTVFLLYRAQDGIGKPDGTSRIGLAYSIDGIHFTKHSTPVLYPDKDAYQKWEWEGGCEDPRIVEDAAGNYYMTYTSYDGTVARLMVATSKDLYHWTKYGAAFTKAFNGKYANFWSKSGSIVSTYINGKIVATKINGKYWMYWGDQNIWAATSDDLINWEPVIDSTVKGDEMLARGIAAKAPELKVVFGPRRKKFDSDLVEPGPPAMLTDKGILLFYNSRNIPSIGDTTLAEGTYCPAQILLDKADPSKVLHRSENYFMKPDKAYEITGQVGRVCFIEGLAQYKSKWYLYYGTADSKIAVAVKE
ncbi:MAG: family 43 glycosylhydrolase [Flavisolibacter sp.]|jgi:predicted GH43/DUF377 family glycosyl hydrolase|nr:family 43 glycosylhydrolase [Flavisolibacter sp.]